MYAYIKGQLEEVGDQWVVIEASHIGYHIIVPTSMLNALPSIGDPIKLYTYLHVREDEMTLFGFITKEDKYIFKKLITVNGIGPKSGLGVLSVMTGQELRIAVLTEDINSICQAPGIGKKTAQKLILDLKDKFKIDGKDSGIFTQTSQLVEGMQTSTQEAIEALIGLGYTNQEAYRSVKGLEHLPTVEAVIGAALKKLAIF